MIFGGAALTQIFDNQATWNVGFAMYFPSIGTAGIICQIMDGGTTQVELRLTAANALTFTRNGTVLATTAASFIAPATWHYYEIATTINNTTGTYTVYMDGVAIMTGSGANTRNTANSFADRVAFPSFIANVVLDDVYMNDGTGSSPDNSVWGEISIMTQYPTGAGATTDWTPSTGANWAAVDEAPPSTADYVSSSTPNQIDTYGVGVLPVAVGTVRGRQIMLYAEKDDGGVRQIAPVVRHSGSNNVGTTVTMAASYTFYAQRYATNPGTGVAWTLADCNVDEIGVKEIA